MQAEWRKTLGATIAKNRKEAGFTQEQLAELIDVNTRSLQAFEAGEDLPRYETLFKIAKALKANPMELLTPVWKKWKTDSLKKANS